MTDSEKSFANEKKDAPVGVTEYPTDSESQILAGTGPQAGELKRQLKNRHIAMIRSATQKMSLLSSLY